MVISGTSVEWEMMNIIDFGGGFGLVCVCSWNK